MRSPSSRTQSLESTAPLSPSAPWDCPHAVAPRSARVSSFVLMSASPVGLPAPLLRAPPCQHKHPWKRRKASDLVVGQASRGLTNIRQGARR